MKISSPKAINWTLKQYGYWSVYSSRLLQVGLLIFLLHNYLILTGFKKNMWMIKALKSQTTSSVVLFLLCNADCACAIGNRTNKVI
jgi:hypothetical protein